MCFFAWNIRGLNSERRHNMTKDWINIHRPLFGAFLETHIMENNKERIDYYYYFVMKQQKLLQL